MAIGLLTAGTTAGDVTGSAGQDVADTVNYTKKVSDKSNLPQPIHYQLMAGSGTPTNNAASPQTGCQMIMIPSEYQAIRIGWAHKGASALTDLKMVISATDNIGDLSLAQTADGRKFSVPQLAGVALNTLSADGWKAVTWGGNATLSLPTTTGENWVVGWSDLITVASRAEIGVNSARFAGSHPLLLRFYLGSGYYLKSGLAGFNSSNYVAETGENLVLGMAKAGDSVTTLSGWTDASTTVFDQTHIYPIIVEAYKKDGSCETVLMSGDSRFASGSEFATRVYRNLQFFVEGQQVASGNKFRCLSVSQGTQPSNIYLQRALQVINGSDSNVRYAVYLGYSINDGTPTLAIMNNCKSNVLLFLNACRKKGIQPIIVTAFPLGTGFFTEQVSLLDDFEAFIEATGVNFISPLQLYGTATYGWQSGFNFDNSHMLDTGYQDLAEKINDLINDMRI